MPFPNWYVLGPNIQYFHEHGVKGLFEEGDDSGKGSDMEGLKVRVAATFIYLVNVH